MRMPFLNVPKNRTEKYIVNFRGLNFGEGYRDGEDVLFAYEAAHEDIIGSEQALLEAAHAALWDGL